MDFASAMVSFVAHVLTILSFAAHVLGGCCWHHGHSANRIPVVIENTETAPVSTCCSHRHHPQSDQQDHSAQQTDSSGSHPGPCGSSHCDSDECQYISGATLTIDQLMADLPVVRLPDAILFMDCAPQELSADARDGARLLSHAARCALLQTWQV